VRRLGAPPATTQASPITGPERAFGTFAPEPAVPSATPPLAAPPEPSPSPVREGSSARTLEEAEIEMIRTAVAAAQGNISVASKRLGISRNTIYRKLRWGKPA
jgi:transcriptional regulator of acetoin/glycerol metabolism